MFFSPFSIAIISLEKKELILVLPHMFVRFARVWFLSVFPVVCSTDRSKAVVSLLVLLFVALWFILRGDLF